MWPAASPELVVRERDRGPDRAPREVEALEEPRPGRLRLRPLLDEPPVVVGGQADGPRDASGIGAGAVVRLADSDEVRQQLLRHPGGDDAEEHRDVQIVAGPDVDVGARGVVELHAEAAQISAYAWIASLLRSASAARRGGRRKRGLLPPMEDVAPFVTSLAARSTD